MNAKCELLGRHVHLQRNGKCAVDISGQKIPLTKEERVAAYWEEQRSFDHTLPLARQENEFRLQAMVPNKWSAKACEI